jgi:hypothetical protein
MSNLFINWWRSQQFKIALASGNKEKSIKLLHAIQKSGAKFSWLEKLVRDKLQLERHLQEDKQEKSSLAKKLQTVLEESERNLQKYQEEKLSLTTRLNHILEELAKTQDKSVTSFSELLELNEEFIQHIYKTFNLIEHDQIALQCTGIDERIFDDFEAALVDYLQDEFRKIPENQLLIKLQDAEKDILSLKSGIDPNYGLSLTPHVYYMKYFLEHVYCLYLAWFLIYKDGLLSKNLNILDIAAGPAISAFGLGLFLKSTSGFFKIKQTHISYYSLDKQHLFQFRGLQFWRKYMESSQSFVNTFFRFVTEDILNWNIKNSRIPQEFFDFIVISHAFLSDPVKRIQTNNNYKQIFSDCLKRQGYALLIIQDQRLYQIYDAYQVEDRQQEAKLVNKFLEELDLKLVWYKHLTSTGLITKLSSLEFSKLAREKLPVQNYMSSLLKKYFNQKYQSHYMLDDYVILARKTDNATD